MIDTIKQSPRSELLARISVYSDEIEALISRHKITNAHVQQIREALFEEPFITKPQFLLKDEIVTIDNLEKALLPFTDNYQAFISDCKKLLCPDNDLNLPTEIKKRIEDKDEIAFFVGAGLSKALGLPLWNELADSAFARLGQLGIINHLNSQSIRSEVSDPKQRLSIFNELMKDRYTQELREFYNKAFEPQAKNYESILNPYEPLCKIDKCIKVTTNIDTQFLKSLQSFYSSPRSIATIGSTKPEGEMKANTTEKKAKTCVVKAENPSVMKLRDDTIYHIHGSLNGEFDDWVLTAQNYLNTYSDAKKPVPKFLSELFNRYTVIFVGYGLEEFSILERLFSVGRKHYLLLGTYSSGMPLFRNKSKYIASLGVVPCPYYMDGHGHDRVYKVLTSWAKQIFDIRTSSGFYSKTPVIDYALTERGEQ